MHVKYFKFRLEPLQRPSYDEGKALYIKYCESCHGKKADGKGFLALNPKFPMVPAPTDLASLAEKGLISPLYVSLTSLEGFSNTSMTPLKDELNHLPYPAIYAAYTSAWRQDLAIIQSR